MFAEAFVDERRHKGLSRFLPCLGVQNKDINNGSDCFYFSVVISVKVVPDGVEGGGNENNPGCKEEVMEHRWGLEDRDEKATQTEQSLTPFSV